MTREQFNKMVQHDIDFYVAQAIKEYEKEQSNGQRKNTRND